MVCRFRCSEVVGVLSTTTLCSFALSLQLVVDWLALKIMCSPSPPMLRTEMSLNYSALSILKRP